MQSTWPGSSKSVQTFALARAAAFDGCDVYHAPAEILPLGLRCPVVVTVHDLMWLEVPRLGSGFLPVRAANRFWYGMQIRRAIGIARRVIAISHATADAIARVFPEHAHKTTVVQHGVDRTRYSPSHAKPRAALDAIVAPGLRYSLIVGQGSPYKNHAGMVRAFVEATADEPDHLVVLVRRFSRVDPEMTQLLRRPEVAAKVVTVPFVPDDLLVILLGHAHALLFASHYEGFGLPALEAMSMGVPVLGSTAAAVREVTGDAALAATPTDHTDLVTKIRALSRDAAVRTELIAAGHQRAAEFTWDRAATLTLDVYRSAAAR